MSRRPGNQGPYSSSQNILINLRHKGGHSSGSGVGGGGGGAGEGPLCYMVTWFRLITLPRCIVPLVQQVWPYRK